MGKIKFLQGFLFGIIFVVFVFCMVVFICAIINDVSFLEQLDIWFSHDADVVKDTLKSFKCVKLYANTMIS